MPRAIGKDWVATNLGFSYYICITGSADAGLHGISGLAQLVHILFHISQHSIQQVLWPRR